MEGQELEVTVRKQQKGLGRYVQVQAKVTRKCTTNCSNLDLKLTAASTTSALARFVQVQAEATRAPAPP